MSLIKHFSQCRYVFTLSCNVNEQYTFGHLSYLNTTGMSSTSLLQFNKHEFAHIKEKQTCTHPIRQLEK